MHVVLTMLLSGVSLGYVSNGLLHISLFLVKWLFVYKSIITFSLTSFIYASYSLPFTSTKIFYTWSGLRSRCGVSLRAGRSAVRNAWGGGGVIIGTHPDGPEAHTASCTMGTGFLYWG
jgi:hypothetical protein